MAQFIPLAFYHQKIIYPIVDQAAHIVALMHELDFHEISYRMRMSNERQLVETAHYWRTQIYHMLKRYDQSDD